MTIGAIGGAAIGAGITVSTVAPLCALSGLAVANLNGRNRAGFDAGAEFGENCFYYGALVTVVGCAVTGIVVEKIVRCVARTLTS